MSEWKPQVQKNKGSGRGEGVEKQRHREAATPGHESNPGGIQDAALRLQVDMPFRLPTYHCSRNGEQRCLPVGDPRRSPRFP